MDGNIPNCLIQASHGKHHVDCLENLNWLHLPANCNPSVQQHFSNQQHQTESWWVGSPKLQITFFSFYLKQNLATQIQPGVYKQLRPYTFACFGYVFCVLVNQIITVFLNIYVIPTSNDLTSLHRALTSSKTASKAFLSKYRVEPHYRCWGWMGANACIW